jgi:hypothetical protein
MRGLAFSISEVVYTSTQCTQLSDLVLKIDMATAHTNNKKNYETISCLVKAYQHGSLQYSNDVLYIQSLWFSRNYLWPSKAATSNGVMPSRSSWSTEAPFSNRMLATYINKISYLCYFRTSQNEYYIVSDWFHYLGIPLAGRHAKGCDAECSPTIAILMIRVRSELQQVLDYLRVAHVRSGNERRTTLGICAVHLRTGSQQ